MERKISTLGLGWLAEANERMQPLRDRAEQLRKEAGALEARANDREACVLDAIVVEILKREPKLKGSKVSLVRSENGEPVALRFEVPQ